MPAHRLSLWSALVAGAVVIAGAAMAQQARSQPFVNASPSWVPIGTAASGSTSAAWFHEPGSRQAVACRLVDTPGGPAVQCVAGKLP